MPGEPRDDLFGSGFGQGPAAARTTRRKFMLAAAGSGLATLAAGIPADRGDAAEPSGTGPTIVVPQQQVPVLDEADVVVCGGGPAGVGAALSGLPGQVRAAAETALAAQAAPPATAPAAE